MSHLDVLLLLAVLLLVGSVHAFLLGLQEWCHEDSAGSAAVFMGAGLAGLTLGVQVIRGVFA